MTLSPRQLEIARLVAEDLADKEIADICQISIHTVREYLKRIAAKLAAGSSDVARRRAIARWIREHENPPTSYVA